MSVSTVVLVVIIIVLLYISYRYFTTNVSVLSKTASLKASNPQITNLASPQSLRYAYGIWVFINTWSSGDQKVIFSRNDNIKLYLDTNTPTLKCDITRMDNTVQTINITNNFPIQKWTHVIVNVDGEFVDFYLDGKLVLSIKLDGVAKTPGDTTTAPVILGNATGSFDAFIAGFQNWSTPIGPQDAWNAYMSGNGTFTMKQIFGTYGVDISLIKDNVEQTKFSIF